jgi:hypothetical protein
MSYISSNRPIPIPYPPDRPESPRLIVLLVAVFALAASTVLLWKTPIAQTWGEFAYQMEIPF